MADQDPMEVEECIRVLNEALAMQYRSVLQYTYAAGSIVGLEFVGLAERLWSYAEAELADTRRMVEKIAALGGEPEVAVEPLNATAEPRAAAEFLVETEREAVAKLHEAIKYTGQEPRSEALEHFIEHLISRKQEQLDQLLRAVGRTE